MQFDCWTRTPLAPSHFFTAPQSGRHSQPPQPTTWILGCHFMGPGSASRSKERTCRCFLAEALAGIASVNSKTGFLLLICVVLTTIDLVGCAAGSSSNVSTSSELTASAMSLSFGNVATGQTSSQNVTLTNAGDSSITIQQVTVSGAGYSASGVPANEVLPAGESTALAVSFSPSTSGSFTGTVSIASTATNSAISITLSGGSYAVNLSWTASTTDGVGYYIYRGTVTGGPYVKLNSSPVDTTSFMDTGIASGQTYYYVVAAVDANGIESSPSNQVSASIPP